jgi:hypothetical protein
MVRRFAQYHCPAVFKCGDAALVGAKRQRESNALRFAGAALLAIELSAAPSLGWAADTLPSPLGPGGEPLGPPRRRSGLAFSEIMYHPRERADGRNLQFIEIYNSNPWAEDLGGWRVAGSVDFTFPKGTSVAGQGFLVVAPSPADVEAVYGITGVLGGFTNNLPRGSGTVRLVKRSGGIVLEVTYSDQPPWPVAADGTGHSLVLARASLGEDNPKAWAASAFIEGSPDAPEPVAPKEPRKNNCHIF